MARRLRRDDELGPAVARWATAYRSEDRPGGAGEWSAAVGDGVKENLHRRGHFAAWIDGTADKCHVQSRLWGVALGTIDEWARNWDTCRCDEVGKDRAASARVARELGVRGIRKVVRALLRPACSQDSR